MSGCLSGELLPPQTPRTNCRSTETPPASQSNVRTFPLNIDLQLSNIINRKKTKRKEQIVVTMHSSIQFRHKASSTYRVKGWRQSLIVQLRHGLQTAICAEGLLCLIFFSLVGRRLLIDMGCFTGSWALASFLLSQDCLTVEFELSVLSNLCHKL